MHFLFGCFFFLWRDLGKRQHPIIKSVGRKSESCYYGDISISQGFPDQRSTESLKRVRRAAGNKKKDLRHKSSAVHPQRGDGRVPLDLTAFVGQEASLGREQQSFILVPSRSIRGEGFGVRD